MSLGVIVLSPNLCSHISPMFEVSDQRLWFKRVIHFCEIWIALLSISDSCELGVPPFQGVLSKFWDWLICVNKSYKAQNSSDSSNKAVLINLQRHMGWPHIIFSVSKDFLEAKFWKRRCLISTSLELMKTVLTHVSISERELGCTKSKLFEVWLSPWPSVTTDQLWLLNRRQVITKQLRKLQSASLPEMMEVL